MPHGTIEGDAISSEEACIDSSALVRKVDVGGVGIPHCPLPCLHPYLGDVCWICPLSLELFQQQKFYKIFVVGIFYDLIWGPDLKKFITCTTKIPVVCTFCSIF